MEILTLLQVFLMVFFAEMGDKSQFLMIAMSTQYRRRNIVFGTVLAVILLNLLAVVFGNTVGVFLPTNVIALISGGAFLCFAYLGLCGDERESARTAKVKWATGAVFGTYFLAELGDKTQLSVIAMAVEERGSLLSALMVFLGATLALLAADFIGLFLGGLVAGRLSEGVISAVSFLLFFVFAIVRLLEGFEAIYVSCSHQRLFSILSVLLVAAIFLWICFLRRRKNVRYHASAKKSVCQQ